MSGIFLSIAKWPHLHLISLLGPKQATAEATMLSKSWAEGRAAHRIDEKNIYGVNGNTCILSEQPASIFAGSLGEILYSIQRCRRSRSLVRSSIPNSLLNHSGQALGNVVFSPALFWSNGPWQKCTLKAPHPCTETLMGGLQNNLPMQKSLPVTSSLLATFAL